MRVLLDTHVLLWWMVDDRRLPAKAEKLIMDRGNTVYVSAVSVWEIAIKKGLNQIQADPEEIVECIEPSGFTELAINGKHAAQVAKLPAHHRDPFDRLLVAQSLVEPMRLLTTDRMLAIYGATVLLT